jgi:hypothetical protein
MASYAIAGIIVVWRMGVPELVRTVRDVVEIGRAVTATGWYLGRGGVWALGATRDLIYGATTQETTEA